MPTINRPHTVSIDCPYTASFEVDGCEVFLADGIVVHTTDLPPNFCEEDIMGVIVICAESRYSIGLDALEEYIDDDTPPDDFHAEVFKRCSTAFMDGTYTLTVTPERA